MNVRISSNKFNYVTGGNDESITSIDINTDTANLSRISIWRGKLNDLRLTDLWLYENPKLEVEITND